MGDLSQAAVIDKSILDSIRDMQDEDDPFLLQEMITLYLGTAEKSLHELRAEDATDDADALKKIAHSLKGSSATIGAARVAACCRVIENMGAKGELERFPIILKMLELEFKLLEEALALELPGKAA